MRLDAAAEGRLRRALMPRDNEFVTISQDLGMLEKDQHGPRAGARPGVRERRGRLGGHLLSEARARARSTGLESSSDSDDAAARRTCQPSSRGSSERNLVAKPPRARHEPGLRQRGRGGDLDVHATAEAKWAALSPTALLEAASKENLEHVRVVGSTALRGQRAEGAVHAVVQDVRAVLPQFVAAMAHEILKRESSPLFLARI
eukprot:COSAG04_NODE_2866_length_3451_cov_2.751492_5_plen_203_part_00